MSKVIAFSGRKGSGKDTAALAMCNVLQGKFSVRTVAFADLIKHKVCESFDLAGIKEYDAFKRSNITIEIGNEEVRTISARHVVREIGMLMRSYDEQQFVHYVQRRIASEPDAVWLVTDLRFENEHRALRAMGATMVDVCRDGFESDGHITEFNIGDMFHMDHRINNNGTMEQFIDACQELAVRIAKEWK
jgi:energy-coupling factor transporter ATP-binding protein EcfA2